MLAAHASEAALRSAPQQLIHRLTLAHVGAGDYFSQEGAGSIDMTEAIRSPGSTLKPLIYAFAFENGIAHPETVLDDRPTHYGIYAPENFDHSFQGTVTARHALQMSSNLPAV